MNKMLKKLLFTTSMALFTVGSLSIYSSWQEAERMPAAVSPFSSSDIGINNQASVLEKASISMKKGIYEIAFPNIKSICQTYDRFSFVFTTPNVKVSGDSPTLEVSGKCSDIKSNFVLYIPYKKIMQERPSDFEVKLPELANLNYKVRDVIGFWPEYWVLTKVSFQQQDTNQALVFDERSVAFATNNSVSMRWK